jgi:hypothetical protein
MLHFQQTTISINWLWMLMGKWVSAIGTELHFEIIYVSIFPFLLPIAH